MWNARLLMLLPRLIADLKLRTFHAHVVMFFCGLLHQFGCTRVAPPDPNHLQNQSIQDNTRPHNSKDDKHNLEKSQSSHHCFLPQIAQVSGLVHENKIGERRSSLLLSLNQRHKTNIGEILLFHFL